MVTALHHVNVTVLAEQEAAAKNFYGSVLGLEPVPKPAAARQSGAWYQIGATQLHLSVDNEEAGPLRLRHISFSGFDLGAAGKKFPDGGVEINPDPRPLPGPRRVYLRG